MVMHTDIPSNTDVERLAAVLAEPAVSIYLPTSPVSTDNEPARIALKNAISTATDQLTEAGVPSRDIRAIEEHADALRRDGQFWNYLSHSLAIFLTAAKVYTYRLPNQLTEAVEVSDRFHLKPLLRSLTFPHVAFVLALSQNSVRLVEITPDSPAFEVGVQDLPTDLDSALGGLDDDNRNSFARMSSGDTERTRLGQYARAIDRALRPVQAGLSAPLILAATDPLASIFRSVSTHPNLTSEGIEGNPDALSDAELAQAAREVLDRLYAAQIHDVQHRLTESFPRDRVAWDAQQVARAATFGAVDTLLVDIDRHQPGFLDEYTGALTVNDAGDAADYGIADEIARRALHTGARVLAVRADDIPGGGAVAALLRYPI